MLPRFKKTVFALLLITVLLVLTSCGGPEATYKSANNLLAKGKYAEAAEKFASLGSYEDATYLTIYADACAKGESKDPNTIMEAISTFYDLSGFKDSDMRVAYYWGRFYETAASRFEKDNMVGDKIIAFENALDCYKTTPLFLDCPARIKALEKDIPAVKDKAYNTAIKEAERGNYVEADEIFGILGDYKDSEKRITYYDIREAEDALVNTTDHTALDSVAIDYSLLDDYLDCTQRANDLQKRKTAIISDKFTQAEKYLTEGKAEAAFRVLSDTASYSRDNEYYLSIWYSVAEALQKKDSNLHALIAFQACGNYKESMAHQRELLPTFANRIDSCFYITLAVCNDGTVEYAGRLDNVEYSQLQSWYNITSIASGTYWAFGVKNNGSVVGTTSIAARKNAVEECSKWKNIAKIAADDRVIGLCTDGTIVGAPLDWTDIIDVDVCESSIVALKSDGTVLTSGYSEGTNTSQWTDIVSIAASAGKVWGLKADGTVVISTGYGTTLSGWEDIVAISANEGELVGLKADGQVVSTHYNVSGWRDIVAIEVGPGFVIGIRADGTAVSTGEGKFNNGKVNKWDLWD